VSDTTPKRRGAPLGNQNARKHGYYSRLVSVGREKYYLRPAASPDIDAQIEFAIAKVKSINTIDPDNVRLLERARGTLRRLARETARDFDKQSESGQHARDHQPAQRIGNQGIGRRIEKGLRLATRETSPLKSPQFSLDSTARKCHFFTPRGIPHERSES
jgi:hypothetical protein